MKALVLFVILVVAGLIFLARKSEPVKAIRYSSSEQRTNDAYVQFRTATGNK